MGQERITQRAEHSSWPKFLRLRETNHVLTDDESEQPFVIVMHKRGAAAALENLVKNNPVLRINDNYDEQVAELVISRNPQLYRANLGVKRASVRDYLREHYQKTPDWRKGSWVYYPWNGLLVHVLEEELFWEMRTIRNRDLITESEQKQFRKIRVGCSGMSVGSNVPLALALQGGAQQIKLVDSAVISGSNLNRILGGVDDIGRVKSLVIARKLYEMNPYLKVVRLKEGLSAKNIKTFFDKPWPIDVIVDEIDDLEMKVKLRVEARKRRLPVLMATELGDDVMLDIERFDKNPNLSLFHGLAGAIEDIIEKKTLTQREWLKYATTIINTKNVPLRMQQSLLQVGSKIVTHPQLGSTAMMAGAAVAYAIRQLSLGHPLKSGRMLISMDQHLLKGRKSLRYRYSHAQHTKIVKRALDAM